MKVTIDIDVEPEELRRLFGMPDVDGLHEEMIRQVKEAMVTGADGYDPLTLLKPYLGGGASSMEAMQKVLMGLMTQPFDVSKDKK